MNQFDLRLDLDKGTNPRQVVRIRQGDELGTTIAAAIFDHGTLVTTAPDACRIAIRLPDGTHYYRKAATWADGTATVTIDETQAASAVGRTALAYFQLTYGTDLLSTGAFAVIVEPDAVGGAELPEDYDSEIQDAIDALDAAVENIADTVEDVLEDHPEWTTTVQDGAVTDAKLYQGAGGILARNVRLMYRLDNLLTATLPEGDSATATDAAKTPLAGLSLYGRSMQDGTPTPSAPVPIVSVGGNLLDVARSGTRTDSGVTWAYNADGTVTVTGTATGNPWSHTSALEPAVTLPAGTYTASVSAPFGLVVQANGSNLYTGTYNAYTFTLSAGSSGVRVYARAVQGTTYTGETIGIMLTRGSIAYPYVPYGHAGLWARGKNLLPNHSQSIDSGKGITFIDNGDGSYGISGTATANTYIYLTNNSSNFKLLAGTYTLSVRDGNGANVAGVRAGASRWVNGANTSYGVAVGAKTFTHTGEGNMQFVVEVTSGTTVNTTIYPQLEAGTTATAYQPYAETVTPIDLDGHELRSLPDGTRDEVTIDERGHVTLVQRVGSVTFDGSNDEGWMLIGHSLSAEATNVKLADASSTVIQTRSDHFTPTSADYTYAGRVVGVSVANAVNKPLRFYNGEMTIAEWTAWLAENPVTVLYPLATPQTIDLGWTDAVPLCGPDLTAQSVPTAPFALIYERDLNVTLARLEAAIAALA